MCFHTSNKFRPNEKQIYVRLNLLFYLILTGEAGSFAQILSFINFWLIRLILDFFNVKSILSDVSFYEINKSTLKM